jgi:hypothetical protein
MSTPPPRTTRVHITLVLCAGLLFSGCTGAPDTSPAAESTVPGQAEIATLPTPEGEVSSTESPGTLTEEFGEPIRLRLDMTEAEEMSAQEPYDRCIAKLAGLPEGARSSNSSDTDAQLGAKIASDADSQGDATCSQLLPLPPWELDPQNSDAVNFAQAIVACLREQGVDGAEAVQEGGRFTFGFGDSVSLGMEHYDQCEADVAAGGTW